MFVDSHSKPWILLVLFASCSSAVADDTVADDTAAEAPQLVELAHVRVAPAENELVLHGVVQATDRAMLAFAVAGRLLERRVDVGDRVKAGDVLARIDARPYQHAVAAARAQLHELDVRQLQLERDADRARTLERRGAAAVSQREQADTGRRAVVASRDAAAAQLAESRRQRNETLLRAPYDGVIRNVMADPGTVLAAGSPVLAIAGPEAVEIVAEATERSASWLDEGAIARVELPAQGTASEQRVIAVSKAASMTGLYPIRLSLSDVAALPGQGAIVRLLRRGQEELRLPLGAVLDPAGAHPFVWRVDEADRVHRTPLRIIGIRERDTHAEVAVEAETLSRGSRIISRGHRPLLEGDVVRAQSRGQSVARGSVP